MDAKRTIEEFSILGGNGGFTFKVVETDHTWVATDKWKRTRISRSWSFVVETNHFGSGVKLEFPLPNESFLTYMVGVLSRTLARMQASEASRNEDPNVDRTINEFYFTEERNLQIDHVDGKQVDFQWPKTETYGTDEMKYGDPEKK